MVLLQQCLNIGRRLSKDLIRKVEKERVLVPDLILSIAKYVSGFSLWFIY